MNFELFEQIKGIPNLQDVILEETPKVVEKEGELRDHGVDKFILKGEHDENKEFFNVLEDLANVVRDEMNERTDLDIVKIDIDKEVSEVVSENSYKIKIEWEKESTTGSPIDPRRVF